MRLSSFFKRKPVIVTAVITAVILVMAIASNIIGFNPAENLIRTVLSPFKSGIAYICDKAYSNVEFLWEMDSYKNKNEELTEENTELKAINRDVTQYREENERLRELLELKQSMSDYSTVAGEVIGYSENNQYDKIELNKGIANGIAEGNTVIASGGVVGRVTEVGQNWCVVTTIISADNAMGIKITRTGDAVVLEGDKELMSSGKCKMTFVNSDTNIVAGDLVETSGSAGIYPAGLRVGFVKVINSDNMGQVNYAEIEPSVKFDRLHEVLIINGVN